MEEKDYYALINYRGKIKYYHILKHYNDDIWIEYLDYNPNRHDGVWIKNGKNKIVEKFECGSIEYNYFNSLKREIINSIDLLAVEEFNKSEDKTLPDMFYYSRIGTDNIKKIYKKAYLNVTKPNHINF